MTRILRSSALALLFGAAALTGCKKTDTTATTASADGSNPYAFGFKVGEAITDTNIAAIVTIGDKSDTLTASEFQAQMMGVVQQNPAALSDSTQARELRRAIVESFAMQPLLENAVESDTSLKVDSSKMELELAQIRQGMDDKTFNEQLVAAGMTLDSVRAFIGLNQRRQQLFEGWAAEVVRPTPDEIEDFRKKMAEEVRVQHIIFATRGIPPTKYDSVRQIAQTVLDSAKKGTDFAALAQRHSSDGTAGTGGVIEFFSRTGPLDYTFKKASFALRDSGDVTPELVQTPFGYHIIRMNHRREGALPDTSSVSLQMINKRKSDAVRAHLRQLVGEKGVTVRINEKLVDADINAPVVQDPAAI